MTAVRMEEQSEAFGTTLHAVPEEVEASKRAREDTAEIYKAADADYLGNLLTFAGDNETRWHNAWVKFYNSLSGANRSRMDRAESTREERGDEWAEWREWKKLAAKIKDRRDGLGSDVPADTAPEKHAVDKTATDTDTDTGSTGTTVTKSTTATTTAKKGKMGKKNRKSKGKTFWDVVAGLGVGVEDAYEATLAAATSILGGDSAAADLAVLALAKKLGISEEAAASLIATVDTSGAAPVIPAAPVSGGFLASLSTGEKIAGAGLVGLLLYAVLGRK